MTDAPLATAGAHFAPDASVEAIAAFIAGMLAGGKPRAIAVPGGSTPGPILAALAERGDVAWGDVAVWLTDDRCVPTDHTASNFGLLERSLAPTGAALVPLEQGATPPPFDLIWLGMGADGHIASLFPNTDPQADGALEVVRLTPDPLPPEAPFDRLSLTLSALVRARHIMLVLKGADKRKVLDDALSGHSDLPIARLLKAAQAPVTIFWSET
ncbi:6-phosphogluconolactonase [Blastomonas sp. SL216]|uniref:6-phosphogluconolactonase n=1 Tax=Blastomonas sp. SL216 TaxID=2995169 RepID=UPI00237758D2|nr:6-phosphogluconolactonase [Blastomonas sp. SL216]